MDSTDEDRLRQRDRIRLFLHVPVDHLQHRTDTTVAAGGRMVITSPALSRVSDAEGNELDFINEL